MSTLGVLEVVVAMNSFRNIDLYYQGLYSVRVSCYYGDTQAHPCIVEQAQPFVRSTHPHFLREPCVLDRDNAVATRMFMIRYAGEVVKLNEIAVFRVEVQIPAGDTALEVRAELFFTDLGGGITVHKAHTALNEGEPVEFSVVSVVKCRVAAPLLSVNAFAPIVFTNLYSSVLVSTIHVLLVDFKFSLGKTLAVEPEEISEVLFSEEPVTAELVDQVYRAHAVLLTVTHNKTRRFLLKVLKGAGVRNRREMLLSAIELPLTIEIPSSVALSGHRALLRTEFTNCIKTRKKINLTRIIYEEIKEVAARTCGVRHMLMQVLKEHSKQLVAYTEPLYHSQLKTKLEESVFRDHGNCRFTVIADKSLQATHEALAIKARGNSSKCTLDVEDSVFLAAHHLRPVLFQQSYSLSGDSARENWSDSWFRTVPSKKVTRLFILVHGFKGSSYDMKALRDTLGLIIPRAVFLSSRSNEQQTEGDIAVMGERLAEEVLSHLASFRSIKTINFIGHSLGGIIIRAALPLLAAHRDKFSLFLSLNSPHLGCNNGRSRLIEAGLWLVANFKNCTSLKQLTLSERAPRSDCFLHKLANSEGPNWFKFLVLASSSQDNYVPFNSARIEALPDDPAQLEMSAALLGKMTCTQLVRLDVNFPYDGSQLSHFIGRSAHIKTLDSRPVLTLLTYACAATLV